MTRSSPFPRPPVRPSARPRLPPVSRECTLSEQTPQPLPNAHRLARPDPVPAPPDSPPPALPSPNPSPPAPLSPAPLGSHAEVPPVPGQPAKRPRPRRQAHHTRRQTLSRSPGQPTHPPPPKPGQDPPRAAIRPTRAGVHPPPPPTHPKLARKAPPGASRVFWKKLLLRARPPISTAPAAKPSAH